MQKICEVETYGLHEKSDLSFKKVQKMKKQSFSGLHDSNMIMIKQNSGKNLEKIETKCPTTTFCSFPGPKEYENILGRNAILANASSLKSRTDYSV